MPMPVPVMPVMPMALRAAALFLAALVADGAPRVEPGVVPVFVMMPLDVVSDGGVLQDPNEVHRQLALLKEANATGVMVDIWWGLVEREPLTYDWTPYLQLAEMLRSLDLKMQAIMSFHSCGGNVGDVCNIQLPRWLGNVSEWGYEDRTGNVNAEYISLFHDELTIPTAGRTPLQMYRGFLASFASAFHYYLGLTVSAVGVGLGPAGELRYPAYVNTPSPSFPGVGEFQCYDHLAQASLAAAATAAGHPEWGHAPENAGTYSLMPDDVPFFSDGVDNYASPYGEFFLSWYSAALLGHGEAVLNEAAEVFGSSVIIDAKVSGIHWQYEHPSHAAELTAGYYNLGHHSEHDAYLDIAQMLKDAGAGLCFTCLEMRDREELTPRAASSPEQLVRQTKRAAHAAGIRYSGENALGRFDREAYDTIRSNAAAVMGIDSFTYLRLGPKLLEEKNLREFAAFIEAMHRTVSAARAVVPPRRALHGASGTGWLV